MDEKTSSATNDNSQNVQPGQVIIGDQQSNPIIGSVSPTNNLLSEPPGQDNKSAPSHRKKLLVIITAVIFIICLGTFITLQFIKVKPKAVITSSSSSVKKSSSNKPAVSENTVDSSTGVDIAGWQTFSNSTYNFSYEYPSNDSTHTWHLNGQNTSSVDGSFDSGVDLGSPNTGGYQIPVFGVAIYPPGSDSDQEYLSTLTHQFLQEEKQEYPSMVTNTQTITKNGTSGSCLITVYQKAELNMPAGYRTNTCRFIYQGKVYLLSASDYTLQSDANTFGEISNHPLSAISQTMLDSFSFTK